MTHEVVTVLVVGEGAQLVNGPLGDVDTDTCDGQDMNGAYENSSSLDNDATQVTFGGNTESSTVQLESPSALLVSSRSVTKHPILRMENV